MKRGHLATRRLRAPGRFGWCRRPVDGREPAGPGGVEYRLFLRDDANVSHGEFHVFTGVELQAARDPRGCIAQVLRGMRAQLRWRVDQLDFARLGLVDDTPAPRVSA